MKIKFKISKLANLFFFISNLSEWSPYCRKKYNQVWLKRNPLKRNEKEALGNIRNALKKHKNIKRHFFKSEKEVWRGVSQQLTEKEKETLRFSLKIFLPRFEKLWNKREKELYQISRVFSKKSLLINKSLKVLKFLYAPRSVPESVTIFLLINPITEHLVGGGGKISSQAIVLECSHITKQNNPHHFFSRVLLHEIIHMAYEDRVKKVIKRYLDSRKFKNIEPTLRKSAVYKETRSFLGTIKEMVAVSLLPEGYLSEYLFKTNIKKSLLRRKSVRNRNLEHAYYDLMLFAVWELYPIAREYYIKKKRIDVQFIEEAAEVWKNFYHANLAKWRP